MISFFTFVKFETIYQSIIIMSLHKTTIDSIISDYNRHLIANNDPKVNIELEAKIQSITRELFVESLKLMAMKAKLIDTEVSANVISNKTNIKTGQVYAYIDARYYSDNVKISSETKAKHRIMQKFNSAGEFMKYSLSLAKEERVTPIKDINDIKAVMRFKLRVTFAIPSIKDWKYDYTLSITKQSHELEGSIASIRNRLFSGIKNGMTIEELMPLLIHKSIEPDVKYEIEVERTSQTELKDRSEMEIALNALWKTFDPNFSEDDPRLIILREIYESIAKSPQQKKLTLKNILNAARSLTKSEYYQSVYPPLGYFVTDKADGERAVVYANGNSVYIVSSQMYEIKVDIPIKKTIIDCELIKGKILGIFDIMIINDLNVTEQTIEERMSHASLAERMIAPVLKGTDYSIFIKEYLQIGQPIEESIMKVYNNRREYKTDGLIITSQTGGYYDTKNYKWKPTSENTIDFLVIECPKTMLNTVEIPIIEGKRAYILMSGMNVMRRNQFGIKLWPSYLQDTGINPNAAYIPVLFTSSIWPMTYIYYGPENEESLHKKICEFSVKDSAAKSLHHAFTGGSLRKPLDLWQLHRIREDRSILANEFGNDFEIAESIFANVIDPFTLEDLWAGNSSYFEKTKDLIYHAPNKFKRFVIKTVLKDKLQAGQCVLDMAAGRGADLTSYMTACIGRLIALDIDPTALVELIRRSRDNSLLQLRKCREPLKLNVLVTDCSGDPEKNKYAILNRFSVFNVDIVVCNFAFHYMCANAHTCANALSFIAEMSNPTKDTLFIFTVMDGAKVFDLLKDIKTGESWKVLEDSVEKYLIRKDYNSDKLEDFAQNISVKLPMTTRLYSEPLCNIDAVVNMSKKFGFSLVSNVSFLEYYSAFSANEPKISKKMTKTDISYSGLHNIIILKHLATKK